MYCVTVEVNVKWGICTEQPFCCNGGFELNGLVVALAELAVLSGVGSRLRGVFERSYLDDHDASGHATGAAW